MIGYKVVKRIYEDGCYKDVSCNEYFTANSALRLEYKDNEIVIAPQGTMGIFIFLKKADAIRFKKIGDTWKIKKVDLLARPIKVTKNIMNGYSKILTSSNFIKKMYKSFLDQEYMPAPHGTYVCRKIRVIEDVEEA